jgi:ferredoxin-NADP reductase
MAQPIHFGATITTILRHSPDVISLVLESHKRLPRFVPGQFLHLSLDPYDPSRHWPESRVFSVANAVTDRKTIRLTISRQGRYTGRILSEVSEGMAVACKGPYGEFVVGRAPTPRVALISGGTGVTPFASFMDAALESGTLGAEECRLYYGARTPGLLVYRELAERCAAAFPDFRVSCFAEETDGADGQPNGIRIGRLDIAAIAAGLSPAGGWSFYLSGPKVMITSFRQDLTNRFAVPDAQVIIDAWE